MNWVLVRAHGTTKPNSHINTDMRRIKRASKMLLRIAPGSWVGDRNVDDFGAKAVNPPNGGALRTPPFGFPGPVFDLDLICFFFAGAPFDLICPPPAFATFGFGFGPFIWVWVFP
jgi:hypothetical protein